MLSAPGPLHCSPQSVKLCPPSLKLLKARLPLVLFSITHNGIEGLITPAIGQRRRNGGTEQGQFRH